MITKKLIIRLVLCFLIVLNGSFFAIANSTALSGDPYQRFQIQEERPSDEREQLAARRGNMTIFTSHLNEAGDIVAISSNGTVQYHNNNADGYWDIDRAVNYNHSVIYTATREFDKRQKCQPVDNQDYCIRQSIERLNLTTGSVTQVYSRVDPRYENSEWHDTFQINSSHFVVADMYADEIFIVNVTSGSVIYEWSLQSYLSLNSGGQYPDDWGHINDVEVLDKGWIMVSVRNHDQVLFINPHSGVMSNWTLGADDNHDILYEQHNPDYIPTKRGGPAVLVADSENNRIVEYQRSEGGNWDMSWSYQDSRLQWPRDADRLPNGNTLISDTGGGRVFEVAPNGTTVWSLDVPSVYEAERLGSGRESSNGYSASTIGLTSVSQDRQLSSQGQLFDFSEGISGLYPQGRVLAYLRGMLPNKIVNGIENGTPLWMGFYDALSLSALVLTSLLWVGFELYSSGIRLQSPIVMK